MFRPQEGKDRPIAVLRKIGSFQLSSAQQDADVCLNIIHLITTSRFSRLVKWDGYDVSESTWEKLNCFVNDAGISGKLVDYELKRTAKIPCKSKVGA